MDCDLLIVCYCSDDVDINGSQDTATDGDSQPTWRLTVDEDSEINLDDQPLSIFSASDEDIDIDLEDNDDSIDGQTKKEVDKHIMTIIGQIMGPDVDAEVMESYTRVGRLDSHKRFRNRSTEQKDWTFVDFVQQDKLEMFDFLSTCVFI